MSSRKRLTQIVSLVALLALPCLLFSAADEAPPSPARAQEQLLARLAKLEAQVAILETQIAKLQAGGPSSQMPAGAQQGFSVNPRAGFPHSVPVPPGTPERWINGIPYYTILLSNGKNASVPSR